MSRRYEKVEVEYSPWPLEVPMPYGTVSDDTLVWSEEIPQSVCDRYGDSERGNLSGPVRVFVLQRDGYRCTHCLRLRSPRRILTIDHIVPRSKGGISHPDNLRVLCRRCHDDLNRGIWS